jgi:Mg2+ and Co2+ transporter CorA
VWRPGHGYEPAETIADPGDGVLWLDFFKPRPDGPRPPYVYHVSPVVDALQRAGVATTSGDIVDLVGTRQTVGLKRRDALTAFGVGVGDNDQLEAIGAGALLVAVPATLLVFPRCLVTVRHLPMFWVGRRIDERTLGLIHSTIAPEDEPFATPTRLCDPVSERWARAPDAATATDLAQLALGELAATLAPGIDYLSRRLESAEHGYFRVLETEEIAEDELRSAQRRLFELARLIAEFGRAAYFFGAWTPLDPRDWFTERTETAEAERVKREYAQAVDRIRALRQDLRASVDMMASTVASRQLVIAHRQEGQARQQLALAEEQRERNERFMRDATLVASVVLLPTLVATVYGSNVALPFKNRLAGSILLIAAMVIGAALAWLVLRRRIGR